MEEYLLLQLKGRSELVAIGFAPFLTIRRDPTAVSDFKGSGWLESCNAWTHRVGRYVYEPM